MVKCFVCKEEGADCLCLLIGKTGEAVHNSCGEGYKSRLMLQEYINKKKVGKISELLASCPLREACSLYFNTETMEEGMFSPNCPHIRDCRPILSEDKEVK